MTSAKRKTQKQPPWQGSDAEEITFGSWLRQQREMRQIGLREIAENTKISFRYLEAFEQDRFEVLPAEVFSKGFLRQYAAYVGLDPDEAINHFLWAKQTGDPEDEEEPKPKVESSFSPLSLVIGLLLFAVVVTAMVVWWQRQETAREAASAAEPPPSAEFLPPAPAPTPVVTPDPEPAEPAEPLAPIRVAMEFTRDCWVEAVVDGGSERIAQTYWQGESLQLDAQQSVIIRKLGNSGGVKVEVNGVEMNLGGAPGRVLRDVTIDAEVVAQLVAGAAS